MSICPLSEKKLEVIRLLADGKTVRDIVEITGRSKNTINNHIAIAFQEAGAANATGLVAKALREGWIQ